MPTELAIVELLLSPDNLQAWTRVNPAVAPETVSEQNLMGLLTAQSIVIDETVQPRIQALVEQLRRGEFPKKDILLVEGLKPVPGEDGVVEWSEHCRPQPQGQADEVVDHYARTSIISVSAGDLICTVTPPTEGTPGHDIFGQGLAAKKGQRAPMQFGEGIVRESGANRMIAKIGGRVNLLGQRVWITPLLVINSDVDFQAGNVNFDGDVLVCGHVLDLFTVKCTKGIVVQGLIEAAKIEAGGDLVCGGGIAGKEKAELTVGGQVKTRFIDNAIVKARGDIFIQREAVNSTITTMSHLETPGAITACTVDARTGIEAALIGSSAGVRTSLVVGFDRETQRRMARLEREMIDLVDKTKTDRGKLDTALQRQKALPDSQKGRLMQLLTTVKEDMNKAAELKKEQQSLQDDLKANRNACIKVSRMIREGTTLQIGKAVTTLKTSLQGPIKLVNRRVDGAERIAACTNDGHLITLESTEV
jgi:hypothetical protein